MTPVDLADWEAKLKEVLWDLVAKLEEVELRLDAIEEKLEAGVPPVEPEPEPEPDPEPLPATVTTMTGEVIPVPGRLNVYAELNGLWDDPTTWSTDKVPGPTDRVRIPVGTVVILSGEAECDVLVIDGEFDVDHEMETSLTLTTLFGMPGGTFWAGDPGAPLTGNFTLTFLPAKPDAADPLKYLGGLVWLGTCTVHGRAKTAWADVDVEILAGENFFLTNGAPQGWEAGDELVFEDTRQLKSAERATGYNQIERHTIKSVDGGKVTLTKPFAFAHLPGKTDDGKADVWPAVANLTRNVNFIAEVPGTAHAIFLDHAKVDLCYCAFQGMGRTTNAPLDTTNLIGRYPVHMHHVHHPFTLEGVVVDQGDAPHNRKWGLTGHGSVGTFRDCVVVNTQGAGIMCEDGTEVITIEGNCVIGVGGVGGRVDSDAGGRGRQGTGIYASGPFVKIVDNFVANVHTAHPFSYAYALSFFRLGRVKPVGSTELVDGNGGGHLVFRGNVAFACSSGLVPWWVGYGSPAAADPLWTEIEDFTSVNHYLYGVFQYPLQRVVFARPRMRGDGTAIGFYGADYIARDFVIRDPDIQGMKTGIYPSVKDGPQRIEGGLVRATQTAVLFDVPWTSAGWADGMPERHTTIVGTKLEAPVQITRSYPASFSRTTNLLVRDTVTVKDFLGKAGDSFNVYLDEQRADFVMPVSVLRPDGKAKMLGAPEPGLTNAEAWKKHKIAIAGEVAPAGATAREGIKGIVQ